MLKQQILSLFLIFDSFALLLQLPSGDGSPRTNAVRGPDEFPNPGGGGWIWSRTLCSRIWIRSGSKWRSRTGSGKVYKSSLKSARDLWQFQIYIFEDKMAIFNSYLWEKKIPICCTCRKMVYTVMSILFVKLALNYKFFCMLFMLNIQRCYCDKIWLVSVGSACVNGGTKSQTGGWG